MTGLARVRQMIAVATLLITEVPAKTAFDAPAGFSAPSAALLACFSAATDRRRVFTTFSARTS